MDLLNRQIKIAWWQIIVGALTILGWILFATGMVSAAYIDNGYGSTYREASMSGVAIFGVALAVISGIASFVLWIIGIIFAVGANNATGQKYTYLVIFAIFTLGIAHIISAYMARNAEQASPYVPTSTPTATAAQLATKEVVEETSEHHLKTAFVNGVITSKEYEMKMKELKDNK